MYSLLNTSKPRNHVVQYHGGSGKQNRWSKTSFSFLDTSRPKKSPFDFICRNSETNLNSFNMTKTNKKPKHTYHLVSIANLDLIFEH